MKIINKIFSDHLTGKFSSVENTELINIDNDLSGLITAGVCHLWKDDVLWIMPENANLLEARAKLKLWMGLTGSVRNIIIFPLPFGDPYVNNRIYPDFHVEKFNFFKTEMNSEPRVIISTGLSSSTVFEDPGSVGDLIISLRTGTDSVRDELTEKLHEMGYSHSNYVDEPGEYRKRGGVLDLFPSGTENPVRIEFFGNRVESLTLFDRNSRRSVKSINRIDIPQYGLFGEKMRLGEMMSGDNLISLPLLLKNPKIIFNDRAIIEKSMQEILESFRHIFELNRDTEIPEPDELFNDLPYSHSFINISAGINEVEENIELVKMRKNVREFNTEDLEELRDKSHSSDIFLFSESTNLSENLKAGGIRLQSRKTIIPESFMNLSTNSLFITDRKFVFREYVEYIEEADGESLLKTLLQGDHIVHEKHGIGVFRGLQLLEFGNSQQEFIKVEYLNNEILYVPVSEANILNKYFSFKGDPGKLDRIGGKSWVQKKSRAKKSIVNFAKELLDLYALRRSVKGFSHKGDADMENHLKNNFPYIETPDQIRSIKDVMTDLERVYPMERLICGDVSFGKTEVAIRAALRVVSSGLQVAVLCPTTILAMQHFRTFSKRLEGLPVNIKMLSRMVPKSEQKEIFSDLKRGHIDILIGTHSILSNKTEYKNLGLFIIDEEQRFGVFQKEKLKQGRENVDVLILSATPIPRTLSLSMAGLQDISTIRTPPRGRMRIRNFIGTFSRQIIVSAVLKEIQRGGGIFIIYNSVEKIFSFHELLKKWLPDIKVAVIHAQMNSSRIEKNLLAFINGEYSVLLSTTIIENGIDITKVNTMIVINAENFGLTQLYQLRGRIGRGEQQAFAYFLTGSEIISEKARLRLDGIRDHAEVGSGFKLAEYDLKLRGAGSLLGNRQHGHIEALGFDYYNSMLKHAVNDLKGEQSDEWKGEVKVDFKYSLGSDYISRSSDRIDFYSRIIKAKNMTEIELVRVDIIDRFGDGGEEVAKVFFVSSVKLIAAEAGSDSVSIFSDHFILEFSDEKPLERVVKALNGHKGFVFIRTENEIRFDLDDRSDQLERIYNLLKN